MLVEEGEFDLQRPVGGGGDLRFELAEFHGREAHGARHGLAMDEGVLPGLLQQILAHILRHFHEIADHVVVLDAQGAAAGLRRVAALQRRDEAAGILLQLAQLVEVGIEACADEAAIALQERQLVGKGRREPVGHIRAQALQALRGLAQFPRQIGRDGEFEPELARGEQAVAHAGEIPRAAASEAEAGEGARQIGRALEDAPQPVAQVAVLDQRRDGILPVADRGPDG